MAAIGTEFAAAQAEAIAPMLRGALLELYAGPRPDRFGGQVEGPLLVSFMLADVQAQGDRVRAAKLSAYAAAQGNAQWYRVQSGGVALIEGSAEDFGFVRGANAILLDARVTLDLFEYRVNKGA